MRRSIAAGWAWAAALFLTVVPHAGSQETRSAGVDDLARGRVHYVASCARCHGVDGAGGEGPPLDRFTLDRAPDDAALVRIMSQGIPGTGMPGSRWLSEGELRQVALFVRSLAPTRPEDAEVLRGDPSRGRTLFEREGCSRCHTVGGVGTARGPDLTTVGARRGVDHLRQSLLDPGAALPRGLSAMPRDFVDYLVVTVVDADGRRVRGARLNEDSYTIQIKDPRGTVRSFYKPDLRVLEKEFDASLMRSYADRLDETEIEDLVAYLASLTGRRARGIS